MARLVYGKEAHLDLLGDKEGDRDMMEYLLGSRLTEAETTTLGVLLTSWFPRIAKVLEKLAPGWFIMTSKMHIWAQEATNRAMQTRPDPVGSLSAAQFLAQHLKVNGSSEVVPSVKYIQSENFDNFSAGSLTTPDTLSWLVYLLSLPQNRHRQLRLRDELRQAGVKPNSRTELHDLNKLPYLDCLLRETLRRYPPIPGSLTRVAPVGGMTVDGYFVPAGMLVSAQAASVHMDPTVFTDPSDWNPERWDLPKTCQEYRRLQRSFWTFGSGTRITYETRLGNDYYEKDEAGLLTLKRVVGEHGDGDDAGEGELFPAAAYEPIALKKL
ncbi:cytochrome P450 [Plectosphaerella cucumerina]|uniref:Cytochrome P450 n=1 Tax=Plectosphaerella cucumerina TaxID=40658 RepID=A0A8K0XAL8_9PEZI|nr:cytochrome P450 [Plectosphaerella cucumerina]